MVWSSFHLHIQRSFSILFQFFQCCKPRSWTTIANYGCHLWGEIPPKHDHVNGNPASTQRLSLCPLCAMYRLYSRNMFAYYSLFSHYWPWLASIYGWISLISHSSTTDQSLAIFKRINRPTSTVEAPTCKSSSCTAAIYVLGLPSSGHFPCWSKNRLSQLNSLWFYMTGAMNMDLALFLGTISKH